MSSDDEVVEIQTSSTKQIHGKGGDAVTAWRGPPSERGGVANAPRDLPSESPLDGWAIGGANFEEGVVSHEINAFLCSYE